jgi:demethylmenaquinone methyltransferase/2-methoxy-6-polyprenyl-1,4-benzoquinol methylase
MVRPHPEAAMTHDGPGGEDAAPRETHFGFSSVPLDEKQARVDDVFHKVASRYDVMNDVMSVGLHRVWKNVLVSMVRPPKDGLFNHLDVAGGTGDVAFRIARAGGPLTRVTVLDINADMLAVGRAQAEKLGLHGLEFVEANAEALPLPDKTFDAYTIAFGIRNVPRIELALKEAYRVLKRGGRFLCLEFSPVDTPVLDRIYEAYSFTAIPAFGKVITGDGAPYRYLVESIRRFPEAETFRDMIADAGFQRASFTRLTGGIVAIHSGWKL